MYNEFFRIPLRHYIFFISSLCVRYKFMADITILTPYVSIAVQRIRVYRQCRAYPPPRLGCSSQFQGRGLKGWVPSCTIYNIFLFSNSYRDGQQREKNKRNNVKWSKTEVNDLFMQNSHCYVLIPCIRSAVEGRGRLWRARCFFLESANCSVYVPLSYHFQLSTLEQLTCCDWEGLHICKNLIYGRL